MFATAEEKIIVAALSALVILVGLFGFIRHERTEGATVCIQQDQSEELKQSKQDAHDAANTVDDLHSQLLKIAAANPGAPAMRVCNVQTGSVSPRPTARSVEPVALPHVNTDTGVQAGTGSGVDIGPGVQDITLGCVLAATDSDELWKLAIEESRK